MQSLLRQVFRIRPGEEAIVISLGFLLLGNSLAMQMSEIAAISNFLSAGGVNQILIVWTVDALLTILTTGFQSLIVDRFNRINLMRGITFGFAIAFVLLRIMFLVNLPPWLNYSLLYLLVGQQSLVFPLIFWILANDVCDMAQTKRLFPLIASWGLTGKLLGIGIAATSPALLKSLGIRTEELLLLNVLIYMLIYALISNGLKSVRVRKISQKPESIRETLTEGWEFVNDVPSFRYLMFSIVALILCDTFIEFRFLAVSNAAFNDPGSYQTFYSFYYLIRILTSLAVQSVLTGYVIEKLGLKKTFFILPVSVLSGVTWMLALPGTVSSLGGVLLQKIPQYTIDESARKAFQALVPEERRGRVSMFMDNYLFAGGTIIGCFITGVIILVSAALQISNYFYIYLAVAMASALFAIWSIFKMYQVYDTSLFNWRLKRRQRGKGVLDKLDL